MAQFSQRGKSAYASSTPVVFSDVTFTVPTSTSLFFLPNDLSKICHTWWPQNIHLHVQCPGCPCLTSGLCWEAEERNGLQGSAGPPFTESSGHWLLPIGQNFCQPSPPLCGNIPRCWVFQVDDGPFTALLVPLLGACVSVLSWSARRRQHWNPTGHAHSSLWRTLSTMLWV